MHQLIAGVPTVPTNERRLPLYPVIVNRRKNWCTSIVMKMVHYENLKYDLRIRSLLLTFCQEISGRNPYRNVISFLIMVIHIYIFSPEKLTTVFVIVCVVVC